MAPAITEILYALAAADRVVGVTQYCRRPVAAQTKPRIGGFITPNLEAVLGVRPDLVAYVPSMVVDAANFESALRGASVRPLPLRLQGIADVYVAIQSLADAIGESVRGARLAAQLRADVAVASAEFADRPRPSVLVSLSHDRVSFHLAGPDTLPGALVALAGGINVAPLRGYHQMGLEGVLAADPDVIIDAGGAPHDAAATRAAARVFWARFAHLRAVRTHRVHTVTDPLLITPGPRLALAVRRMGRLMHATTPPAGAK